MKAQAAALVERLQEWAGELAEEPERADDCLSVSDAANRLQGAIAFADAMAKGSKREPEAYPPRVTLEDLDALRLETRDQYQRILLAMGAPADLVGHVADIYRSPFDPCRPANWVALRAVNERAHDDLLHSLDAIDGWITNDDTDRVAKAVKTLAAKYRRWVKGLVAAGEMPKHPEAIPVIVERGQAVWPAIQEWIDTDPRGRFDYYRAAYEEGLFDDLRLVIIEARDLHRAHLSRIDAEWTAGEPYPDWEGFCFRRWCLRELDFDPGEQYAEPDYSNCRGPNDDCEA